MEVLMTRRASRTLMGVLSVTTVIGASAYAIAHWKKAPGLTSAAAASSSSTSGSAAAAAATAKQNNTPLIVVASGATTKPAVMTTPSGDVKPVSDDKGAQAAAKPAVAKIINALAEGKAKIDGGELLAGRKILNDALIGGALAPAEAATAKQLMAETNKTLVFGPRRISDDPWTGGHQVVPGDNLQKIAFKYGLTPEFLLRVNGLSDARKLRAGAAIKVVQGPFHAIVNKKSFAMDVYLGSPGEKNALYVTTFPVGLGKDDSTPTGTWIIEQRIPNPKWWGARGLPPIEAGDPKNPLGKYWLALAGIDGKAEGQQSYGIHGTNEPESIGKQASMGCIRMKNEDIAIVYELLVAGKSTVVVRD
jgi:lipoprotein-anchoring transpeptidase ErfK/SrfK